MAGESATAFAQGLAKYVEQDAYVNRFNSMIRAGNGTTTKLNKMLEKAAKEGILHETGPLAVRNLGKVRFGFVKPILGATAKLVVVLSAGQAFAQSVGEETDGVSAKSVVRTAVKTGLRTIDPGVEAAAGALLEKGGQMVEKGQEMKKKREQNLDNIMDLSTPEIRK